MRGRRGVGRLLSVVMVALLAAAVLLPLAVSASMPGRPASTGPLAAPAWSGTGHFVLEAIGYIPSPYTVQPNFR